MPSGRPLPAPASEPAAGGLVAAVWRALRSVTDPEIPVLDVVEMGIVRDVELTGDVHGRRVTVTITPTFSACPAIHEIERGVREAASAAVAEAAGDGRGAQSPPAVEVVTRLYPPWSSDDMTDVARAKLERFGIAPAQPHGGLIELALDAPVRCPRCGHPDTRVRNHFGSTLCREIRSCAACLETFERFKPL